MYVYVCILRITNKKKQITIMQHVHNGQPRGMGQVRTKNVPREATAAMNIVLPKTRFSNERRRPNPARRWALGLPSRRPPCLDFTNSRASRVSHFPNCKFQGTVWYSIWWFPENSGTPRSSILVGFSPINHPAYWGSPMAMETSISFHIRI